MIERLTNALFRRRQPCEYVANREAWFARIEAAGLGEVTQDTLTDELKARIKEHGFARDISPHDDPNREREYAFSPRGGQVTWTEPAAA